MNVLANPLTEPDDDQSPEPFSVAAVVSLQERRYRTMKTGDTFGVFDHGGDILSRAGQHRWAVSPGHPLPVAAGPADRRRGAAAAHLDPRRRQRHAHVGRLQRFGARSQRGRARPGRDPRAALAVPGRWRLPRPARGAQLRLQPAPGAAGAAFRGRFLRPVRGARHAPRAPRRAAGGRLAGDRVTLSYRGLDDCARRPG